MTLTKVHDLREVLRIASIIVPELRGQIGDGMGGDVEGGPGRGRVASNRSRKAINERGGDPLLGAEDDDKALSIEQIAGVVETDEIPRLKKLIFRATKGKAYMYAQQFEDNSDVQRNPMSVYIILF